jgi:hypothetical protein
MLMRVCICQRYKEGDDSEIGNLKIEIGNSPFSNDMHAGLPPSQLVPLLSFVRNNFGKACKRKTLRQLAEGFPFAVV